MGLIREPKNVDFFVIDDPMTEAEKKEFSRFIQAVKQKNALATRRKRTGKKVKATAKRYLLTKHSLVGTRR
jgi:hypothetical protein